MQRVLSALALVAVFTMTGPAAAAAASERFDALGHKILVKIDGAEVNNAVSVLEFVDRPGVGPPLHIHTAEDEIFHVVRGRIRIWRGDRSFVTKAGDTVFLPRGVPHAYMNIGREESRILVTIMPGNLVAFFREAGSRKMQVPRDMDELVKLSERYGMKILGPPSTEKSKD